ncbi:MAG: hypothetical protein EBY14_11525 [Betaproteobacteria bacterium]|nr:hypothetical protein [Betaproteobacteria bacterium]NDB41025.1 hypothetical protein [Betaproteobacteria bacterium]
MFRQVKGIFSGTNGRQAPLMRNKRRPQIDETALILRCNISNQPSWQGPWAHPPEVSACRLKCSPSACQSPAVKESPAVKQSPAVKESPVVKRCMRHSLQGDPYDDVVDQSLKFEGYWSG